MASAQETLNPIPLSSYFYENNIGREEESYFFLKKSTVLWWQKREDWKSKAETTLFPDFLVLIFLH